MRLRRLKFLGVAFAIVAAACSPYDFSKPVSDLAAKAQALALPHYCRGPHPIATRPVAALVDQLTDMVRC
jgi:hypothetical protein